MRVIHLEKQVQWCGQTYQTLLTAQALRERGHDVALACDPKGLLYRRAQEAGIEALPLSLQSWRLLPSALRLAARLRRRRCDVLHAHGVRDHQAALIASRLTPGAVVVRTKHNDLAIRHSLLYRRYSNGLIAVSEAVRRHLVNAGVPSERVRVIPDGIPLQRHPTTDRHESLRRELGFTDSDVVIGMTGLLVSWRKDAPTFLRAAAEAARSAPHARFLLVGLTDARLEALARDLGIAERTRFTGWRDDVPALLRCMDIYAQSSVMEALSCSILEAMATGLPVVATRVGGIPEAVEEGVTGLLCPPQNPSALAQGLLALIARPDERRSMGRRARARVEEFYDLRKTVLQIESVYREAMRNSA